MCHHHCAQQGDSEIKIIAAHWELPFLSKTVTISQPVSHVWVLTDSVKLLLVQTSARPVVVTPINHFSHIEFYLSNRAH